MPGNFTGRYGWAQAASSRVETLPVKIECGIIPETSQAANEKRRTRWALLVVLCAIGQDAGNRTRNR